MLPPTAVVAAQMDALQMNDWPEPDSGVRTAFLFSKPFECESMIAGRVGLRHPPLFAYLLMRESHNAQRFERTTVVEVKVHQVILWGCQCFENTRRYVIPMQFPVQRSVGTDERHASELLKAARDAGKPHRVP